MLTANIIYSVSAFATTAPTIPQISTLPGPQGSVKDANQYVREQFLPNMAMSVIRIAIPVSVVMLVFGAIRLLTAYGNDEKITLAKKTLTWSVVGLIISLLSYAIVQIVFYGGFQIMKF